MKNKKIIIGLIVVVVVIAAGIFFWRMNNNSVPPVEDNGASTQPKAEQSQNKLETEDFSINLPNGWEESTSTRGVLAVAVNAGEKINNTAAQKINFKSYFAINKDKLDGKSINEYSETLKSYLAQNIPGTAFTKEEDTTINGKSAHLIEMEFTQEGLDLKILTALVEGLENDVWAVSFNTPRSAWDGYKEMFYDTANTFKLKN